MQISFTVKVWALVVAQLIERSLPSPEIRGHRLTLFTVLKLYWNTKIKKKESGNGPSFFKKKFEARSKIGLLHFDVEKDHITKVTQTRLLHCFVCHNERAFKIVQSQNVCFGRLLLEFVFVPLGTLYLSTYLPTYLHRVIHSAVFFYLRSRFLLFRYIGKPRPLVIFSFFSQFDDKY